MFYFNRAITGIDLGNSIIKVAFCNYRKNRPYVIKALKINLPQDYNINEDLDFCIESTKRSCKFAKIPLSNVAIVANDSWYNSFVIALPDMPKKDLEKALLYEIKRQSNIDLKDIIHDYYPNKKLNNQLEYYVFYADKPKIENILKKFKNHGINVKFIDVEEMTALALYKNIYADDKTIKCFFDFGYLDSKIIFTKEESLIFTRNISSGTKQIKDLLLNSSSQEDNILEILEFKGLNDPNIEEKLKDYLSEILYEIIRTINFFTATYKEPNPSNIIFSGGIFAIPGFFEYFCQNIQYPCILNNVLDLLDYKDEGIKKSGFMFNYAVGVALR